ncbi:MAG: ABC transporter substrate-binding protein [Rhodospirillaceae bacterium]|nr:ABC transporter substrate-binding protein [Rhodospirillaceae bacterium]
MLSRRHLIAMAGALAVSPAADAAESRNRSGYPRSYDRLIEEARREKTFVIYTTMFPIDLRDAFADFRAVYPFIKIEYVLLAAGQTMRRVVAESAQRKGTADLVWLHSMDESVKLINDGYAQAYNSPEKPGLPDWAVWRNEGWAITAEPAVIVYNKDLVPAADVPKSRDDFEKLLRRKTAYYSGKVGTYNAATGGVGFRFFSEDIRVNRDTWSLIQAIADCDPTLYPSSEQMVNAVKSGKLAIAYNVLGTHAFEGAKEQESLGVVLPSEYTQMNSNIAFIPKEALHPSTARLFLDYVLSERGQRIFTRRSYTPVNMKVLETSDVPHPEAHLIHAVRMGPGALATVDVISRSKFADRWSRIRRAATLAPSRPPDVMP